MAENHLAILLLVNGRTLPEIDKRCLEYHRLLKSLPRSNFTRPVLLLELAALQTHRFALSGQSGDRDKAITHFTEAVLFLSPLQAKRIVSALFYLASLLLSRFPIYEHLDDLKFSIKYFRFLRINFHSVEAFDIPHTSGDPSSQLFSALTLNLRLSPGEMAHDLEEMVALIPEFITADTLTYNQKDGIQAFGLAVATLATEINRQENTQRAFNRAIHVLREAAVLNPDLVISYALFICLVVRFETTAMMKDCEEAMTNFDRIFATVTPGSNLTRMERHAMEQIPGLLVSRVNLSPTPENLEDAIHRLRTFGPYSPNDEERKELTDTLDALRQKRFMYFGVTGNPGETPLDPHFNIHIRSYPWRQESMTRSQFQEKMDCLGDFTNAIMNGETTGVEVAVESGRQLLPLQQSSDRWSFSSDLTNVFAGNLLHAYYRTKRLDYLNEAITTYQDLHNISAAPKLIQFYVGCGLRYALVARVKLSGRRQHFEELMELCSELANDGSGEVFTRFDISCFWASCARATLHSSAAIAYETAMSLL